MIFASGALAQDHVRDGVLEAVAVGGHHVRVESQGGATVILAADDAGERVLVSSGGDRVALSDDGAMVAFVAPRDGVAAVWVVPFSGGAARPVTPPVVRSPGRAPAGFVPPPRDRSLRFVADEVCWTDPAGTGARCVVWR